jgi:hypothetical protein
MPDTGDQGTGMLAAIVVSEAAAEPIKPFVYMPAYSFCSKLCSCEGFIN